MACRYPIDAGLKWRKKDRLWSSPAFVLYTGRDGARYGQESLLPGSCFSSQEIRWPRRAGRGPAAAYPLESNHRILLSGFCHHPGFQRRQVLPHWEYSVPASLRHVDIDHDHLRSLLFLAGTKAVPFMTDASGAGEFPYTRGIYPDMYRSRLWTMRQYAGFGSAEESNQRYHYLIAQGTTGLSVAFDLPTQMGLDSDHPRAQGEVGKVGVAICSLDDMAALFEGIPLAQVSTSMTINSTAAILLALYAAVARRQGADLHKLSGTVQNDILKEYIARGTY